MLINNCCAWRGSWLKHKMKNRNLPENISGCKINNRISHSSQVVVDFHNLCTVTKWQSALSSNEKNCKSAKNLIAAKQKISVTTQRKL